MRLRLLLPTLLLAACTTAPAPKTPTAPPTAATAAPEVVVVPERYVSAETPADELDSLATWPGDDGMTWLIATGKSSHRLVIYDAEDGTRLREFGSEGSAPGQFDRPNGIAVYGDHVFVVERDNHRVQVLSLPDLELSVVGQNLLQPYHYEYAGNPGPLIGIKRGAYVMLTWTK